MSLMSEEEMDAVIARVEAQKLIDDIETKHYWEITYPEMTYHERLKVWDRDLWFTNRNGGYGRENMNYLNKAYLNSLIEKEPDIVKIYDELLQKNDWIDEVFGDGTIDVIRKRINENPTT